MFIKERDIPLFAQKCEALIRNLPQNHPMLPKIKSELSTKMSGYYGEKSLDYHLGALDEEYYDFYPGLRLSNNGRNFQIDSLGATNYYLLVMEVKNLRGELEFDSAKGQLIQRIGEIVNVYDDPFAQVQNQRIQLMQWLKNHRFPPIPVECLVVLSNTNALIKKVIVSSKNHWKLCRCINVHEKIGIFDNMYQTEYITPQQRRKFMKMILKNDTPLEIDILSRFNISSDDIVPGVYCPNCDNGLTMVFIKGFWNCSICLMKSKNAHFQKINDYFLIMNASITNQQFRQITGMDCRHKANRILNSMGLPYQGTNRGRVYFPKPPQK
jgi:hypothetical protein